MEKKLEKKYQATSDVVEISMEAVETLMRSERWSETRPSPKGEDKAQAGALADVLQRPELSAQAIDIERLTRITSEDIIDRFLRVEPRRIVAEQGEVESDIVTEASLDEEEDFVSEELAEVYLAQGLNDMAKETYRKLSLLNPEKSVYFAEIISKIDSNN